MRESPKVTDCSGKCRLSATTDRNTTKSGVEAQIDELKFQMLNEAGRDRSASATNTQGALRREGGDFYPKPTPSNKGLADQSEKAIHYGTR